FIVEAEVEGSRLDSQTGILVDFKVLKKELKDVLEELDHCHLNELPEFKQQNPSSEHLARYIHRRLGQRLGSVDVRVRSVAVMESEGSSAVYLEE
ncbi:MAG: 6-pyruvoyl trahydropterin synthase family protein, partial [Desulfovibrionales bacterium]